MKQVTNDHVVCFDVDDTLIMWHWDAQDENNLRLVEVSVDGFVNTTRVLPHDQHIELLKRYKAKGKTIIVWSQSGNEWAAACVQALGLEAYVDFVFTKPEKYIDDLDANEWMEHVYFGLKNKETPHN